MANPTGPPEGTTEDCAGGVDDTRHEEEGLEGSQYSSPDGEPDNFDRYVDAVDEGMHMGMMDTEWPVQLRSMNPARERPIADGSRPMHFTAVRQKYQPSGHPID